MRSVNEIFLDDIDAEHVVANEAYSAVCDAFLARLDAKDAGTVGIAEADFYNGTRQVSQSKAKIGALELGRALSQARGELAATLAMDQVLHTGALAVRGYEGMFSEVRDPENFITDPKIVPSGIDYFSRNNITPPKEIKLFESFHFEKLGDDPIINENLIDYPTDKDPSFLDLLNSYQSPWSKHQKDSYFSDPEGLLGLRKTNKGFITDFTIVEDPFRPK